MSNPRNPISSTKKRKCDHEPRGEKDSPERKKMAKTTEVVAFDVVGSMSASEYLSRVNREAKEIPDIMVADEGSPKPNEKGEKPGDGQRSPSQRGNFVPIDGSAASLAYLLSSRSRTTPLPSEDHLPKTESVEAWAASVIANFERLREHLAETRAKGVGGKRSARAPVPAMKDGASWHVFCVGSDDARGNSGAYFADDYSDNDNDTADRKPSGDKEEEEALPPWRIDLPVDGYEPTVSLLLQMDQVMIRRVLSHMVHYIDLGWSPTSGTGRRAEWIYALLARLEKPVHRDDASVLFRLLKHLTLARSKLDIGGGGNKTNNRSHLAKLNTLIVLVGLFFEQGGSINNIMGC